MPSEKEKLKETLQKKTLLEIETMMMEQKRKISIEKDLMTLSKLNSELAAMKEVHEQKLSKSGRLVSKAPQQAAVPVLKSYDDYLKSKKK